MRGDRRILHCILKDFSWSNLKKAILKNNTSDERYALVLQIEQAKRAWQIAQEQMHWADKDMLEATILKTTACERRYIALLQQAKNQCYQVWDMNSLLRGQR
ncbi:DUF2508 domain-containing protein [Desulforamulus aeronauticus]|uniref:DUF2508 family protein n=1 Tax=Desulforamulus aeronauticus DSM 10349 TaxID=1121421 RepID=A0A1M6UIV1_9FIRM|nr:DUF2508 domain-containing protein [Desulforamulus aeronauticus]SHK69152.1 hypothetical protein SAMN02745123_02795 [Desulforamulus aeronauticus DSM 10349]